MDFAVRRQGGLGHKHRLNQNEPRTRVRSVVAAEPASGGPGYLLPGSRLGGTGSDVAQVNPSLPVAPLRSATRATSGPGHRIMVAVDRRATGSATLRTRNAGAITNSPRARRSRATAATCPSAACSLPA
jgi:hypothetical protein